MEDDEVPVLNVLSNSVIAAVGREVTMPDRRGETFGGQQGKASRLGSLRKDWFESE